MGVVAAFGWNGAGQCDAACDESDESVQFRVLENFERRRPVVAAGLVASAVAADDRITLLGAPGFPRALRRPRRPPPVEDHAP